MRWRTEKVERSRPSDDAGRLNAVVVRLSLSLDAADGDAADEGR
jgi:hypothetical protein